MDGLSRWIREIPKVELHLHLEGSLRPDLLRRLARKNDIPLPPPDDAGEEPAYRYANFLEFLECFKTACSVLKTPEDLAVAAESLFDELIEQHVLCAEVFLSPVIHERRGISTVEVMRLLHSLAEEKRRRHGLCCLFLFDSVRQWGIESCQRSAQLAEQCQPWGVTGIGIGGDEASIPASAFAPTFERAKRAGLHLTVHAGEACGAQSIHDTLTHLKPERIGHGIRAVEDPALLQHLQDAGVTLDISLTSNLRTGVWPDLETHPVRRIHEAGVSLTLNTDDPALFFTTLTEEYAKGARLLALDEGGVQQLVEGALQASFLDEEDRAALGRCLDAEFSRLKKRG